MKRWAAIVKEVRGLLFDNLLYKVVSFLFAVGIWALVQSEQVVEERFRVPLRWKMADGLVTTEAPLDSVTLTLQGVQTYVRAVRQKELAVTVDLTSASEGEVNVDLSVIPVEGLPEQVRVTGTSPANLQVVLDRQIKRKVLVKVATRGEVAPGFVVKRLTVSPDRVELAGPASVLRNIDDVLTDAVDLSALRESVEFPVGLDVKKGQIGLARPTPVSVSVEVVPVEDERRFEAVPVVVRSPGSWSTSATTMAVTLTGPSEAIAGLAADRLSVLVYLPEGFSGEGEARRGGSGLRFDVVHPGGESVKVSKVEPEVIVVRSGAP